MEKKNPERFQEFPEKHPHLKNDIRNPNHGGKTSVRGWSTAGTSERIGGTEKKLPLALGVASDLSEEIQALEELGIWTEEDDRTMDPSLAET